MINKVSERDTQLQRRLVSLLSRRANGRRRPGSTSSYVHPIDMLNQIQIDPFELHWGIWRAARRLSRG